MTLMAWVARPAIPQRKVAALASLPFRDWRLGSAVHPAHASVLDSNPRGRAFLVREGFSPTGLRKHDDTTGHWLERLVKTL